MKPSPVFAPIAPRRCPNPLRTTAAPRLLRFSCAHPATRPRPPPHQKRLRYPDLAPRQGPLPVPDFREQQGSLIDFPNDTTRIGAEMIERLRKLMGGEEWRIEEITYQ